MNPLTPILNRIQSMDEKLDRIETLLHEMEIKLTRRVDRNSLILNGMLWFVGAVVVAGLYALSTFII